MSSSSKRRDFKRLTYLIAWSVTPLQVKGYAFQTPGWSEFHACVRYGNRFSSENLFDDWLVDHFETGMAISLPRRIKTMKDAPQILAERLESIGRAQVHATMRRYNLPC